MWEVSTCNVLVTLLRKKKAGGKREIAAHQEKKFVFLICAGGEKDGDGFSGLFVFLFLGGKSGMAPSCGGGESITWRNRPRRRGKSRGNGLECALRCSGVGKRDENHLKGEVVLDQGLNQNRRGKEERGETQCWAHN